MTNYTARNAKVEGVEVVQLSDAARKVEVSVAVSVGNMAYEYKRAGQNYLWFPFESPAELQKLPKFCGIPFLAPWANRLDDDAIWANGKKYVLNPALLNLRRDANMKPIHGVLNFSPEWRLVDAQADERSAWCSSRLDFLAHPEMMAQFPFAHTITMMHRLRDGVLEIQTALENRSAEPMPIAVGFHPYVRVHDAPRERWKIHIAALEHRKLNQFSIPTGEVESLAEPPHGELEGRHLDDVYTKLVRGSDGCALFALEGAAERVTVTFGPKYSTAVVFAPLGSDFVCFEPMSAITNAFNMAHAGLYKELQSVPPGGIWSESFWISAT